MVYEVKIKATDTGGNVDQRGLNLMLVVKLLCR